MRFAFRAWRILSATGALVALCLGASSLAWSQDLYLIAHPQLRVSIDDVREAYLGDMQFSGPVRLKPVHHAANHAHFVEGVLRMTPDRYGIWWTKKSFRDGLNPPDTRSTDEEIVKYVSTTPGALGYVASVPVGDVQIVQKVQVGERREAGRR